MTTLYEGAFAKLNLTLDVLGKRPDGYHDLKSVMQTISVRDDVEIDVDTDKKTLTVTDRGIGMTAEEIDRYINQIAFSGAEEFLAKYKDQDIIGHFGLGF